MIFCYFFFKQKTAYDMRISDWSSDMCSSDLDARIWRHFRRISTPYPDRFRSLDRIRRIELLSLLLLLRRWGARLMAMSTDHTAEVPGFSVRSEVRRVGKEYVSTCRSGCSSCHKKKKINENFTQSIQFT